MIRPLVLAFAFLIVLSSCGEEEGFCNIPNFSAPQDQLNLEIAAIDQYLTDNNLTAQVDPSGIRYIINSAGSGRIADACTSVTVVFKGTLLDGTEFSKSPEDVNGNPISSVFILSQLIPGWQIGLPLIKPTGSITLYIPSGYGYGTNQTGDDIPPNSTLIFDIYLKSVTSIN